MKQIAILSILVYVLILAGCSRSMSATERDAIRSFNDVLAVIPAEGKDGDYQLAAPDRGAVFSFTNSSLGLIVDVAPFVDAGLDADALDCADIVDENNIRLNFSLPAGDMLNGNIKDTAQAQFQADINYFREYLDYNNVTERYIISIEDAKIEWNKDIENGEAGIVFVLKAEPLVAAGVEPQKVTGWEYVQVSVEENGKTEQCFQFQNRVKISSEGEINDKRNINQKKYQKVQRQ